MPRSCLLAAAVAASLAATSCDDTTAGVLPEEPGAPKLVRIMVQDIGPYGGRGIATDILNSGELAACDDVTPCSGAIECYEGQCIDYLNVNVTPPEIGTPLLAAQGGVGYGGVQIRVVFSKPIDPEIETIGYDENGKKTFTLAEGVVQLRDGEQTVDAVTYYDPAGATIDTSDPVRDPFGPAIVIKPKTALKVATTYGILIDTTRITDRAGKKTLANAKGKALPDLYQVDFTTEGLFVMEQGNCPSYYCEGNYLGTLPDDATDETLPVIAGNDHLRLEVNADIDEESFDPDAFTVVDSEGKNVPILVFNDRGADPTACEDYFNPRMILVAFVDEKGEPVVLPAGDYTLTVAGIRDLDSHATEITEFTASFTSTGEADEESSYAVEGIVLPAQCETMGGDEDMAEPPDMAVSPDMAKPADMAVKPVDMAVKG